MINLFTQKKKNMIVSCDNSEKNEVLSYIGDNYPL